MQGSSPAVRPTRLCLTMLNIEIPTLDVKISDLNHDVIVEAQRLPQAHAANGAKRILSLSDSCG
ncbi:hypothetical protein HH310_07525 [Actinoplanes sp. TBRC 11911]|uniref:hypothetical protein n=1 Tax=Actinoplanes sp. TBRC 11911 TaxID=2729386 RepID=UPI00145D4D30|nr:hypothetical protein [Actinoplanes sp. TBRC 11911]NMO51039.1 hypothetical protein [Actinoplanes sp. TBRC 11911]